MKVRAATIAAAMIAFILSSAHLAAAPEDTGSAADQCLTTPRDYTPPGTRWRYRIERSTGRHCWYLKDDAEKAARKAPGQVMSDAEEPPPPRRKPAAARALSDARAELSQTPVEQAPAPSAPAAAAETNQPAVKSANMLAPAPAARWPDPKSAVNAATSPAPPAATAEQSAEAQSSPAAPATKPQIMPRAVPPMPASEKPLSLPMLITIIAGGLSVFGVIVSLLLAWRASRGARLPPGLPLSLETPDPDQPRRPGDLYRERKRLRALKGGRSAA